MRALVAVALSAVLIAEPALAGARREPSPLKDSAAATTEETQVRVDHVKSPASGQMLDFGGGAVVHVRMAADEGAGEEAPPAALRPITAGALAQANRLIAHGVRPAEIIKRVLAASFEAAGRGNGPGDEAQRKMFGVVAERMAAVVTRHEAELDAALARALAQSYDEATLAQTADFLETPEGRALTAKLPDLVAGLMQQAGAAAMPRRGGGGPRPPFPRADPAAQRLASSLMTALDARETFTWQVKGKLVRYDYPVTPRQMAGLDATGRRMARDFNARAPRTTAAITNVLASVYSPDELMAYVGFALSPTMADLKAGAPVFSWAIGKEVGPVFQVIGRETSTEMESLYGGADGAPHNR